MPTQRRFEGPTLAAVLAKIQDEIGSGAKIVSAQKIRSGGFVGFFQKERYEVIVDMDASSTAPGIDIAGAVANSAPVADAPVAPAPVADTSAPLAATSAETHVIPPAAPAPAAAEPAAAAPVSEPEPAPTSIMDLVEDVNQKTPTAVDVPLPEPISTESDSFADVLSRIAYQAEATPETAPAQPIEEIDTPVLEAENPATAEVIEEDFDEPEPVLDVELDEPVSPEVVEDDEPVDTAFVSVEDALENFDEEIEPVDDEIAEQEEDEAELASVEDELIEDELLEEDDEEEELDEDLIEDELEVDDALEEEELEEDENELNEILDIDELDDEDEPVAVAPIVAEVVTVDDLQSTELATQDGDAVPMPALRTRITDSPLAQLGVPVSYIPETIDLTNAKAIQKTLAAALDELPKAPKIRPSKGSIIAVVGPREEAIWTAEELAIKWKRPTEEIVTASQDFRDKASQQVIRTIHAAEDARRSWSRRNRPTIVVVDVPMGTDATTWGEHILAALEPIATFGIADATRKTEDIASWVEGIGGVDAIALNHIEETVSPASVLGIGIPVDTIDGRQATPSYWAMILAERLLPA